MLSYMFANADVSKLYCVMGRSDSISVVDTKLKAVESVVDLHTSLSASTTILNVTENAKTTMFRFPAIPLSLLLISIFH
jgi:hypothetical protein